MVWLHGWGGTRYCYGVRPDLDQNCLTLMVILKEFFKNLILKKATDDTTKKICKISQQAKCLFYFQVLKVERGVAEQTFTWRGNHDLPGSVGHTDLETWRRLSHNHWTTLFGYYNISIHGK